VEIDQTRGRAAAIALAIALTSCTAPPVNAPVSASASATAQASPDAVAPLPEEQRHEAGAVTVTASWLPGASSARVALDTHSVELDGFDLSVLARVRLDGGQWVIPTAWDAPKGGHHRSGTLTFGSLEPRAIASARVIELEIRDVGASHLLRWQRGP
jgi:hypothetical protein